jgi:hypothetical protein
MVMREDGKGQGGGTAADAAAFGSSNTRGDPTTTILVGVPLRQHQWDSNHSNGLGGEGSRRHPGQPTCSSASSVCSSTDGYTSTVSGTSDAIYTTDDDGAGHATLPRSQRRRRLRKDLNLATNDGAAFSKDHEDASVNQQERGTTITKANGVNNHDTPPKRSGGRRTSNRSTRGKETSSSKAPSLPLSTRSGGKDSVLLTVLFVGIFLSLMDVVYIHRHLELSSSSTPDVTGNEENVRALLLVREDTVQGAGVVADAANTSNDRSQLAVPRPVGAASTDKSGSENNAAAAAAEESSSNPKDTVDNLHDKEPILRLIEVAGIEIDPVKDADLIADLPTWTEVTNMYGKEPVLYGFNEGNCQKFQAQSDPAEHLVGTAGTFNSGTNLLSELLIQNCHMPDRQQKYGYKSSGVRWQVPWYVL